MGIGKKRAETMVEKVSEAMLPSDGRKHVIALTAFTKVTGSATTHYDEDLTSKLESVFQVVQDAGREVVDVKMDTHQGGVTGNNVAFNVFVIYR